MEEDFDDAAMDACLIAAGQRAEHYEMAAYGTLVAWANAMGHTDAADLLQQILDEEKAADEKLSELAEGGINQEAASGAHPQDEAEEADDTPARPVRAPMRKAAGAGRGAAAAGRGNGCVRPAGRKPAAADSGGGLDAVELRPVRARLAVPGAAPSALLSSPSMEHV